MSEKTPKLRFKDENGGEFPEWEETTLGELSKPLTYGLNVAAIDYDGENKYIRITDIDEQSHRYIDSNKVSPAGSISEDYRVREGDILFARTGASTGKSYMYRKEDGKMYYAGFLIRALIKKGYDHRFVFYQTLTRKYKNWVSVMSMRSGQPGINAKEYSSFKFYTPSLKEQQKIADYLSAIDRKIEKEKEKLEALEEQKKGFLQQMFV
ncbi:restriction endonuclease subunit S [Pueribacillus sp. YX66]|uniref:restriction endonuclease subunit S n=1 Tax=Pueribacillus sp. YX66 TaxID=3229242 RepID=UPI00358D48C3